MTCLAAWRGSGGTWVGADSAWTEGSAQGLVKDPKVWRSGNCVVAACGAFRAIQLLKYGFSIEPKISDREMTSWLVRDFTPAFLGDMIKHGQAHREEDALAPLVLPVEFIVASRRRLWVVGSDLSVMESHTHYATSGSGGALARGSLATLPRNTPGRSAVLTALNVAAQHDAFVRAPFTVEKV